MFPRGSPRIYDHNPILHSPFYTASFPLSVTESMYRSSFNSSRSPERSVLARRGEQSVNAPSFQKDRLYKTRPKSLISNPITGNVKKVEIHPRNLEGLDIKINKHRFVHRVSPDVLAMQKTHTEPVDRISGALRKEVNTLTYVNPYLLKANRYQQSTPIPNATFQRDVNNFF